jgi:hypothetical protein
VAIVCYLNTELSALIILRDNSCNKKVVVEVPPTIREV